MFFNHISTGLFSPVFLSKNPFKKIYLKEAMIDVATKAEDLAVGHLIKAENRYKNELEFIKLKLNVERNSCSH